MDLTLAKIKQQHHLTNAQWVMIRLLVRGLSTSEIANQMNSGDFYLELGEDFSVTTRTLYTWQAMPSVKAAMMAYDQIRTTEIFQMESERINLIAPSVTEDLMQMKDTVMASFKEVIEGDGGRTALARLRGIELWFKLSGLMSTERVLHSQERITNTSQGLTSETAEKFRNLILYGPNEDSDVKAG